jgi:myo-inositol-1(or 4)-monophosphatase
MDQITTAQDPAQIARAAHLAQIARDAALSVGPALRAAFRSAMEVDHKVDLHDPVTIHDRATEAALRAFLMAATPDAVIVGEEDGASGETGVAGQVNWFVDPIDGTANFAVGLAFWCVSIGAVIDGEIVAGAVYDPMSDQMFWADAEGAWCNDERLTAKSAVEEARAVLISGYPVARDFRLDGREISLERFGRLTEAFATLRRPGSAALTLCHVAAGWADAAVGFGVNAWDVTAAILILRRAGGVYHPLRLGRVAKGAADYTCPGYRALGPQAHYPTLETLCDEIDSQRNGAT